MHVIQYFFGPNYFFYQTSFKSPVYFFQQNREVSMVTITDDVEADVSADGKRIGTIHILRKHF